MISALEFIFLLPSTLFLGPALIYLVFIVLPVGIWTSHTLTDASALFNVISIAFAPLVGLITAWFIKIRGVNRVARNTSLRLTMSAFLAFGIIDGGYVLSQAVLLGTRNNFVNAIFLLVLILPAIMVGIYQFFRLIIPSKN